MQADFGLRLPLGWAIIIAVLIYVIDRRNLWSHWKRAALPIAAFTISMLSYPAIREKATDWWIDYYTAKHVKMKKNVIARYKNIDRSALSKVCTDEEFKRLEPGERSEVVYAIQVGVEGGNFSLCE